ncbi:hypothetical protein LCGC14_0560180 [marine sediment metagenome]|uniref:Uncharacterized protein n=1 Tax=marine sediment metagenome TaxID=412755 RepID=A0A0F9U8R5_9ZZZZ
MNKLNKKWKKIERKLFKKRKKKFPEDFGELERKNLEVPEEFGKDLEKLTEKFAEEIAKHESHRLTIPKEDEELGPFTGYSDIG